MSDRFDITLEHKLETKPAADAGDALQVRRVEVISGTGRRRRWSTDDKARILVESAMPGANVSDVARRHGMSPQQLFAWRREARALFGEDGHETHSSPSPAGSSAVAAEPPLSLSAPAFAQVVIAPLRTSPTLPPTTAPLSEPRPAGTIEIVIGGATVRVTGEVAGETLIAVLAAVRRAS
jgi:transposase